MTNNYHEIIRNHITHKPSTTHRHTHTHTHTHTLSHKNLTYNNLKELYYVTNETFFPKVFFRYNHITKRQSTTGERTRTPTRLQKDDISHQKDDNINVDDNTTNDDNVKSNINPDGN